MKRFELVGEDGTYFDYVYSRNFLQARIEFNHKYSGNFKIIECGTDRPPKYVFLN